jgi:glycerophosphoryl diester phosphodiesterase
LLGGFLILAIGAAALPSTGSTQAPRTSPSLRERLAGFRVGAHRGDMSVSDQNTLQGFERARQAGVDIVETDLRVSRDGEVFLFHDKRMDDRTTCAGLLEEKTSEEIRSCRLRGTETGLSTFREILTWSAGRIVIAADIKNEKTIAPAIRLVREFDADHWVYLQVQGDYRLARSLDARVALLVAPKGPQAQQQLDGYLALKDQNLVIVELEPGIRTPQNIRAIHDAGKISSEDAWHFGREQSWWHRRARCDEVFRLGIDIAITNMPETCVGERQEADHRLVR